MKRFTSKSVLVTGAASGIGKSIAHRLASEGADVMVGDLNPEGAQATASELHANMASKRLQLVST